MTPVEILTKVYLDAFKLVGVGLATIGLVGVGMGVGIVFCALISSVARNPSLKDLLFRYALLGFSLTEAVGLLALMLSFLFLFYKSDVVAFLYLIITLGVLVFSFIFLNFLQKKFYYKQWKIFIAFFTLFNIAAHYDSIFLFLYFHFVFILFLTSSQKLTFILRAILLTIVLFSRFFNWVPDVYSIEFPLAGSLDTDLYVIFVIFGNSIFTYLLEVPLAKIFLYAIPFGSLFVGFDTNVICMAQNSKFLKELALYNPHFNFYTRRVFGKCASLLLQKQLEIFDVVPPTPVDRKILPFWKLHAPDLHKQIDLFYKIKFSDDLVFFARKNFLYNLQLLESSKGWDIYNESTETIVIDDVVIPSNFFQPLFLIGVQKEYSIYNPLNYLINKSYDYTHLDFNNSPLHSARLVAQNTAVSTKMLFNKGYQLDDFEFLKEYYYGKQRNPCDFAVRKLSDGVVTLGEVKSIYTKNPSAFTLARVIRQARQQWTPESRENFFITLNNLDGAIDKVQFAEALDMLDLENSDSPSEEKPVEVLLID